MSIIHPLLQKLQNDVQELQKGLQPDHLSFWYQKIISDTKEKLLLGFKIKSM
jgi:hypothetical protein